MDTSEANHLGRFIRECRANLGYTSRKVEEITRGRPGLSAISHSNLLTIEKGLHVPTFDKILTLALVFNVPIRHFEDRLKRDMLGADPRPPAQSAAHLLQQGTSALRDGEHQRAFEIFTSAYVRAREEHSAEPSAKASWAIAEARLQAANCRARLGLVRVAKEDLEELLADEDTPPAIVARSTFLLAELYRELRNLRLALVHARAALEMLAASDDDSDLLTLRAKLLTTIGSIHVERADAAAGLVAYRDAHAIFARLADHRACALVSRNLGETYLRLGDYVAAAHHLGAGLAVARLSGDRRGVAYGLVNLARAHLLQSQLGPCREAAREAKEIAQSESYPDVLFASLFYLWRVATVQGQSSLARVYADRLAVLNRKLETRCAEAEEWARLVAEPRRIRA